MTIFFSDGKRWPMPARTGTLQTKAATKPTASKRGSLENMGPTRTNSWTSASGPKYYSQISRLREASEGHSSPPYYSTKNGRAGEIRTHDLLHPMQARYQTTLQPVN